MRAAFLIFILLFSCVNLHAQDENNTIGDPEDEEYTETESTHVLVVPNELPTSRAYQADKLAVKRFDETKWKKIAGDIDFNEEPEEVSKQREFSAPWAGAVLKLVSYIVVIGLVVWLLYYVVVNTYFESKIRRTNIQAGVPVKTVENIEEIDIDGLLDRARKEGNFKMAVRMYYLSLLRKLHELGMISWKKDKTNRDYMGELFLKNFYFDEVKRLTLFYETVWYGDHVLKPESFQDLASEFETVFVKIKTVEKP